MRWSYDGRAAKLQTRSTVSKSGKIVETAYSNSQPNKVQIFFFNSYCKQFGAFKIVKFGFKVTVHYSL